MDTEDFLRHLESLLWYQDQMVHVEQIPVRDAMTGQVDPPLDERLYRKLDETGVASLYAHQVEAVHALRQGHNIIVATPAASGKSMCYNLPVIDALLTDRSARALYLYPTKALAQDQEKKLAALIPEERRVRHGIFDGDTPSEDRSSIRRLSQVVISNPDMLHLGILPNHRAWHQFLRGLRYVVVDEAHVYRGVFGSHVSNVMRRLRRLCRAFGNEPQFILCSATIANPAEHAERLVGLPFEVIEEDGSPYGGKDFVFWNPPMIDMAQGSRRSTNGEATQIFSELLRKHVRTMTFVRSRRTAELIYVYVRDQLKPTHPIVAKRIAPYRASYLPEDRRRIERDLFEGRLLGITTTNAMELGVDVGNLDATLITGYPGSIASAWQQAGRSGRRGERSLSVMIAHDNPLDQYLMRHPESFFGKSHESARISPSNPYILKPHLLCAAYEAPLTMADTEFFGPDLLWYADELQEDRFMHTQSDRWHLQPEVAYPAEQVNIRSASSDFYTLVEEDSGAILETVSEETAFMQLHPGAIYLHQGEPYLIKDLDLESHTAYADKSDAPFYTVVRDYTETRVLNTFKSKQAGRTTIHLGEVNVSTHVVGFRRKSHYTDENLGEEFVDLPPQSYDTIAFWFDVPPETLGFITENKLDLAGGLHAVEHAAIGLLPLFALCDRNDIGGISTPLHPDTGQAQVFVHDGHPGGVGVAERGYDVIEDLWQATYEVISECPCEAGCPSCIHSPKCGANNQPLDKELAKLVLKEILAKE
ncbi:MAG: DEAD/DEAH box helicase [SAR202 cluster bacterium]|jgi:DEAD/DEAH box helicase domain-containing protein|nr:DEAD/DEAH box helicase [SAR202 cluster bacterium]MDP6800621.1 DEAD/DEAH box helicase [SAR202 cluster bacterium]MQG56847.1 DEAD/DEAH box helicase [SAR202 cluster bacterium]MQG68357.1 DEAD/DEAH box helicase [SAR202 cluster bacterium]HAL47218.1 DEAD/DEAH box helicase [Dehalococcoidia bacterium]|tara:strand:+ start:936 stop:3218 length:2283 start_codon:yes stop_codon:yes gene_type:complete